MAHSIQWNISIRISEGPQLSMPRAIEVEAYDSISITIRGTGDAAGADIDREVELQPGGAGQVTFLAITADRYDTGLTYKVNADTNPAIALDQPCFLVGQGAVSLLDTAPARLFFSSGILQNAAVRILVGRDATP